MAIIALRGWYVERYEPLSELRKRPHDIRLSRNSLLKAGLRADFLEERHEIEEVEWFNRYLAGEAVEFYIEGSGSYRIANIDLSSHEIYFTKQEGSAYLDPKIFLSVSEGEQGGQLLEALEDYIRQVNRRSRLPLSLELAKRPSEGATRLSSHQLRQIRKSLLFIADVTPLAVSPGESPQLLPSPNVCVELGYALQCKQVEQILLARVQQPQLTGAIPFDLPSYQEIEFPNPEAIADLLPNLLDGMLQRFALVS